MQTAVKRVGIPRRFFSDFSFSALIAGFTAVLVGYSSSAAIVLQAAYAVGATESQAQTWLMALGVAMGLLCVVMSLRTRAPALFAWSTPGAALMAAQPGAFTMHEAVGAFIVCSVLITAVGASGVFARFAHKIPKQLASAMLAGILLKFGLVLFGSMHTAPALILAMLTAYFVAKAVLPRFAVLAALAAGVVLELSMGWGPAIGASMHWILPEVTRPTFTYSAVVGLAIPLFIVTMASQNLPGVAVLKQNAYGVAISPLITATGVMGVLLAPFGVFALNLAAITAAICGGPEAHEDPSRRYVASVCAGWFYILAGILGSVVVVAFSMLSGTLVAAVAGIALFGTLGAGLADAVGPQNNREAALITFLVAASGVEFFGIGSAVWALCAGGLCIAFGKGAEHMAYRQPRGS